jgi:hypothetical protein
MEVMHFSTPFFLSWRVEINVCNFARAASTSLRSNALAIPSSSLRSSLAPRRLDAAARHADDPQPRCHRLLGMNSRAQTSQRRGVKCERSHSEGRSVAV